MSELNEIALRSVKFLEDAYFKISDGKIQQYVGPVKSTMTMLHEGWNKHSYLKNYITNEYPVFELSDFTSKDGITIEKKSKEDLLKEELNEYIELYTMNRGLALAVKSLKDFALGIAPNFLKYEDFNAACSIVVNSINQLSCSQLDKANLLLKFNDMKNKIYEELDKLGLEESRRLFSMKYNVFLLMVG